MSESATATAEDLLAGVEEEKTQFITFFVDNECMAFEMNRVKEIVRVPQTVDVPLTPNSLVGLANLRGMILPVLSLRRVLNITDAEHTDATRVVVLNHHGTHLGFIVDRVTRVISIDNQDIEDITAVQSTVDSHLLSGVLKNVDQHPLIQLIDVDALTESEYQEIDAQSNPAVGMSQQMTHQHETEEDEEDMQLVSFKVEDQEYAFDIADTQEIIRLPEGINTVPNAPAHVLGMVNLRQRVLPLVHLRTMFGLPRGELDESHRIVVLTLVEGGSVIMVGVVVDEVREVLRIRKERIEDVPELLLDQNGADDLQGICQLDNGRRIVSLLSAAKLFNRPELKEAIDLADGEEKVDEMTLTEEQQALIEDSDDERQLVVFQLNNQEYGIMIESVKEIIRLPSEMTQVPKTAEFIDGMINLRGSVLPIIDMRTRFSLERMPRSDRQRILVLSQNNILTGFVVDSVAEVLRVNKNKIEKAPNLSEDQARIMGKIANLNQQKRMITVLEPEQLLSANEEQAIVQLKK